jgi:hypothetical protein
MQTSSVNLPVAKRIDPASVHALLSEPRARTASRSRMRTAKAVETRDLAPAPIPMSEVRSAGYTVFRGQVLDIGRFAKHHPGGSFLAGRQDATLALENAHGSKASTMHKMLARFYVGPFAEATRDPLERDVLALRADLVREGMFTYPRCFTWSARLRDTASERRSFSMYGSKNATVAGSALRSGNRSELAATWTSDRSHENRTGARKNA